MQWKYEIQVTVLAYGMGSKWWTKYQDVVEVVIVDDASEVKMSGGDVDVEPYLNSRNTIGHGTTTQILKAQSCKTYRSAKRVRNGGCGKWWRYGYVYAEVSNGGCNFLGGEIQFRQGWTVVRWLQTSGRRSSGS